MIFYGGELWNIEEKLILLELSNVECRQEYNGVGLTVYTDNQDDQL